MASWAIVRGFGFDTPSCAFFQELLNGLAEHVPHMWLAPRLALSWKTSGAFSVVEKQGGT